MARWRGEDNWKGEPWGLARRDGRDDEGEGCHYTKSHVRRRSRVAPGSARAPMTPPVKDLPQHQSQSRTTTISSRDDRDDEGEGCHYTKFSSRSQSRVAPGYARAPMTLPVTHLPRHRNQSRAAPGSARDDRNVDAKDSHNAKSRSRSQSRATPGSARVDNQTSSNDERCALAAAQREGGDKHRLWLDRKYRKRAWKRHARDHLADPHYPGDLMQRDWHELLERAPDT